MDELKRWKWSYLALTLAGMLLGLCLMIWPGISAGVLCAFFGVVLAVTGGVRIGCYFCRGISVLWHRYELPLGLLDALLGVYLLSRPENVRMILPTVVGIVMIVDSVFKLQTALELRSLGVKRWFWMLIFSILCILIAVFLIRHPFQGQTALTVYLGASLVIDGAQSLYFVHKMAKDVRKLLPVEADVC